MVGAGGIAGATAQKVQDGLGDSSSSLMTVANPLLQICTSRKVICLQLDICDWTHLCSHKEPLALAELVHTLFCDFDIALSNTRYRFSLPVCIWVYVGVSVYRCVMYLCVTCYLCVGSYGQVCAR